MQRIVFHLTARDLKELPALRWVVWRSCRSPAFWSSSSVCWFETPAPVPSAAPVRLSRVVTEQEMEKMDFNSNWYNYENIVCRTEAAQATYLKNFHQKSSCFCIVCACCFKIIAKPSKLTAPVVMRRFILNSVMGTHIGPVVWKMDGWFSCRRHLLVIPENLFGMTLTVHYGYSLASHWVYISCYCGALWDWKSPLDNIHYGFGQHYEWLSPPIVPY